VRIALPGVAADRADLASVDIADGHATLAIPARTGLVYRVAQGGA
jgi:hypothetical protein